MKIGQVLRETQPEAYEKLNRPGKHHKKKERKAQKENLSFSDIENLMRHDGYCRAKGGALRQVRRGE